jgi:uncharacterized protein (TIGR00730 family)
MRECKNFLCVYCGSSPGRDPIYLEAATDLGRALVASGYGLVYGGASVGLMGAVSDSVLAAGGSVLGVLPRSMAEREIAHPGLDRLFVVESMHERKQKMEELSAGMVALPGGFGTLEETFEILTWAQLGYHQKPVGLLDINGFYQPLLRFLDSIEEQGFIKAEHRRLLLVAQTPRQLIEAFENYQPRAVDKWLDRPGQL